MKPDLTTFIAACPADIRSHFQEQTYSFQDKLMEQNKKSRLHLHPVERNCKKLSL